MPFEGFLDDLRARPLRLRLLGYLASVGLHLPPLTVFAVAWLTQELVLDHALDLPDIQRPEARLVYYEVPAHFVAGLPDGVALSQAAGGSAEPTIGTRGARHGKAGEGKRRSRRPLEFNPLHRKATHGPVPLHVAGLGPEESGHDDGTGTGAGLRSAAGDEGDGEATAGHTFGVGSGAGHGDAAHGTGGGDRGLSGPGRTGATLGLWIPPELHKKEGRAKKEGEGRNDDGEIPPEGDEGEDDVAVMGPPRIGRATRVSMNYAAYLRTFESYPSLPDSCWPPGRVANTVLLEVCVSERGDVKDVVIRQSAGPEVDSFLSESVRTWRYRPRIIQGMAMPFCHPIRLVYTRTQRWDRSW